MRPDREVVLFESSDRRADLIVIGAGIVTVAEVYVRRNPARTVHLLNAPAPAATTSLAIAQDITETLEARSR